MQDLFDDMCQNASLKRLALQIDASSERSTLNRCEHLLGNIPCKNMYTMACIAS